MNRRQPSRLLTRLNTCAAMPFLLIGATLAITSGCAGRFVDSENAEEEPTAEAKKSQPSKDDLVSQSLARAQSRIEELDAKVSALTDKLESTRIELENVSGPKSLKTTVVGFQSEKPLAPSEHETRLSADHSTVPTSTVAPEHSIQDFKAAMAQFKNGKYNDAQFSFSQFTERYPEHALAGSAQFYSGESYFMLKEYKLAMPEYERALSAFATSPRAASAMIRLAHCHEATGNKGEAMRLSALAKTKFPGNPSLDWPSPGAWKKAELPTSPIEPELASHPDSDKHLDNLDADE